MKLPNIYVDVEKTIKYNLALYFDGQVDGFTCALDNNEIATATVEGATLTIKGLKAGSTSLTITAGGKTQTVTVMVRQGANSNGWM